MNATCPRCHASLPKELAACPRCLLSGNDHLIAGHYVLEEEVGRGGMGVVWKGRDTRLDRTVAIKILSSTPAADHSARLLREARALALAHHRNIVDVYDVGEEDGHTYLVMEWVDGQPLSRLLPLSPARAVEVALALCDALEHAHARGLIHRDVKPENVLIAGDGTVKLGDFGIARHQTADWTLTRDGVLAGTPPYLPPEAKSGAAPDLRFDIYALGVVLWQMLTGKLPGVDSTRIPPALAKVASRALDAAPAERYASAAEMRADLVAAQTSATPGLPAQENDWLRAVALLSTLATALVLWAALASVTPKVLSPGEVVPLTMLDPEPLADGRFISRARFETWPTLMAVLGLAGAIAAYGVLRRHWESRGLQVYEPERAIPTARWAAALGVFQVTAYAARLGLESFGIVWTRTYSPLLGGLTELVMVYLVWLTLLQMFRAGRPLWRERWLWAGVACALVPPSAELIRYLGTWHP